MCVKKLYFFRHYEEINYDIKVVSCILQDPFLLISKVVEGGTHVPICKTEAIKNDHSPTWKPVYLNIQQVGSKV